MKVLVTGAAGFIGSHVAAALLDRGDEVVGFDSVNAYYDPSLKEARLRTLDDHQGFDMVRGDLLDADALAVAFDRSPDRVVHLAAQAGVRYSITNPKACVESNILGTLNLLEACRHHDTEHLVYASSSSVYGANTAMPFSVHQNVDHPVSLYAATKKGTELLAHSYSHLFRIPTTGLRFFTVYGPWGRPDMSYFLFTKAVVEGRPVDVFNHGQMKRDFTYIDDIVEGVVRVVDRVASPNQAWSDAEPDPATSAAPYRLYNIGNNSPVELMTLIHAIETALGKRAILNFMPMQPGDVEATYADIEDLVRDIEFTPSTPIQSGIERFVEWYCEYHSVQRRIRS